MITRASRKEATNMSTAVSTAYSVTVYQVSTGRTFIMTDLIFTDSDAGSGLLLFDGLSNAAPTAATTKLRLFGNPHIITDMQGGIEFSTGVAAKLDPAGSNGLSTYSVFVAGYER